MPSPIETTLPEAVPVPSAYNRQLAYIPFQTPQHGPNIYYRHDDEKINTFGTSTSEADFESFTTPEKEPTSGRQKSVLIFLRDSRIYVRGLAVAIMIVSLSLILTAVIRFSQAQNAPGQPLSSVPTPENSKITDYPCIVFSGIAAMNLVLSVALVGLSCLSSKFKKSSNALNATFALLSAIGFASAMGACFFLNKKTKLENDLWKWSCANHRDGVVSDALDFKLICNVVAYGWRFGLVQAALELLTFVVSVAAFLILKYSFFAKYGYVGRVF